MLEFQRLVKLIVDPLQLTFERRNPPGRSPLRLGEVGRNVLQIDTDLGQLQRLHTQRRGHALHFGGVVDRVLAVFSIPGRFEAATGFLEGRVGLGGASTRRVKRLRQLGNLGRPTRVQAVLDRPGIAAGLGDQRPDVYVAQLHTTAFNSAALPSSMSVNPVAAWRAFSPTVINACR
ncbi:Uncharacterised protein [Mycobacterium tuberculosis]|uniref:Uncharacterized protein n=1 Tax=Mycobacterium tuberculosis TaxID=1773 RepID=A0A654U0S9_MYCTX|nr:Uncharacterised protein [Mycobacterium tuberculosis]